MAAHDADIRPSPITPGGTGTARRAKPRPGNAGARPGSGNFWPPTTFTSSSPSPTSSTCWRKTTHVCFTIGCLRPAPQPCWKSRRIPQPLGAEIGILSILHTWGQNLLAHPHIHWVIPAGGISRDLTRWVHPRYPLLLPVKVLSRVFRGKFIAGLKRLYRRKLLRCAGPSAALADEKQLRKLLRRLHRQDWVVYAKPAFGGPLQVLRYLGRYTHRVAISNHRIVNVADGKVTFRWKDYAHGNQQRQMTLTATEFLRRFFLHVLPKGFVRIRHFGFLANRFRVPRRKLCRQLLANDPLPPASSPGLSADASLWHCPPCGTVMVVFQRFRAEELYSRCSYCDLHRTACQTGPPTCPPHAIEFVCPHWIHDPPNLLSPTLRRLPGSLSDTQRSCPCSFSALGGKLPPPFPGFKRPFHLPTRPPQAPAASF